jgi:hypothetical protein
MKESDMPKKTKTGKKPSQSKKSSRVPKQPMKTLPEGFEYSEEARESLRERSKHAKKQIDKLTASDEKLAERVRKIQKANKGKAWVSKPQKPLPISKARYEAWMMEFAQQFSDALVDRVLAEIVKTKRAK